MAVGTHSFPKKRVRHTRLPTALIFNGSKDMRPTEKYCYLYPPRIV